MSACGNYRTHMGLTLLNFWLATNKVVKALGARLGTVYRESEIMVLEVETNTWKIDNGLDAGIFQLLGVTCGCG